MSIGAWVLIAIAVGFLIFIVLKCVIDEKIHR